MTQHFPIPAAHRWPLPVSATLSPTSLTSGPPPPAFVLTTSVLFTQSSSLPTSDPPPSPNSIPVVSSWSSAPTDDVNNNSVDFHGSVNGGVIFGQSCVCDGACSGFVSLGVSDGERTGPFTMRCLMRRGGRLRADGFLDFNSGSVCSVVRRHVARRWVARRQQRPRSLRHSQQARR